MKINNKQVITFVSSYKVHPNMEGELYNFGRMLHKDFELHFITGKDQCPKKLEAYYEVHEYRKTNFRLKGLCFGIRSCFKYLRSNNPNVLINIAKPFPVGLSMIFASMFFNVKTVFRITGDIFSDYKMYEDSFNKWKTYFIHNVFAAWIYKKADEMLVLGDNLKEQALENGFSENRITVIPQPFDELSFKNGNSSKEELRKKWGLSQSAKIVLFIGSASYIKGPGLLKQIIDCFKPNDGVQFCLIGDGLHKYFKGYPEQEVKVVGRVPYDEISDFFQAADILVQTSRREGLPNIILEAIASRLPVIATPVGENENYVTRIAENTDEFVQYILSDNLDPDFRPKWFNWKHQEESYKNFFNNIIE